MTAHDTGPALSVPANASRFFADRADAQAQPRGTVQLAWDPADPYLLNSAFDPTLVSHDEAYCTSVVDIDRVVQVPTLHYFESLVAPHLPPDARVCDIGCGQGEFVDGLRRAGVDAIGFDPVLRHDDPGLHARYWTATDPDGAADLYVMRCVLPHIPQPWEFLRAMGDEHPQALVLVEFQRLEWIFDLGVWYQLNHDHVNLLSTLDLEARFDVVAQGTFSHDEWAWVLLRPSSHRAPAAQGWEGQESLGELLAARTETLAVAATAGPLVIWGAAGKGIVLADALQTAGAELVGALDADPARHGLHMEVSGVAVTLPEHADALLARDPLILVSNPHHLPSIRSWVRDRWRVLTPSDLRTT